MVGSVYFHYGKIVGREIKTPLASCGVLKGL